RNLVRADLRARRSLPALLPHSPRPGPMAPKFDPNEVKIVKLRQYGGEGGAVIRVGTEGRTAGHVPQKDRRRYREGHVPVEGHPRDGEAHDPEPRGEGRRGAQRHQSYHQESQGEPLRDRKKTKNIKHSGNLTKQQIFDIVRQMREKSQAKEFSGTLKEVLGSCRAVGCTVDGTAPATLTQMVDDGEFEMPEK
ncbi:unnamed protein product, partial [Prorocentrum cordatum]